MSSFYFKATRKLYKAVQIGARIGVFTISFLAFVGAAVVGLTQLESFRGWMLGKGLNALNGELVGRIEIGDISGNFISGLTLHDVRLVADSTTLLYAPVVDLNYQLRPIFEEQVVGAKAVLHQPVIKLIKSREGVWNFDRVTKPAKDSIKTPFNWNIDVQMLEVVDATVTVHDLTQPPDIDTVSKYVDYSRLDLRRVNLSAQAHIAPTEQSIWIQNMTFDAPQPDVRLVELSGNISIDTTGLTVRGMRIETERTLLSLDGHLDSVNVLGVGDAMSRWQTHPLELDLDAERISTLELERFVPDISFLGGSPALELSLRGTFGDMRIEKLALDLTHSDINLTGRLRNLDNPDSLFIDAKLTDTKLSYQDVPLYVPGLGIPDLAYLGTVNMRLGTYSGRPDNFISMIDATTAVGSVRGGARFDMRGRVMEYAGDIALVDANLAPVFDEPDLQSDFTGRAVINGRGTSIDELDAAVRLESQGSMFAGREYRWLYVDGRVNNGGYIDLDTLLVAWGGGDAPASYAANQGPLENLPSRLQRNMETVLGGQLMLSNEARRVFASSPSLAVGGWIDLRNSALPRYELRGRGSHVDLSKIMLDPTYVSNLTFTANISGSGTDPDEMEGTGRLVIAESMLGKQRLPATTVDYRLERLGPNNRLFDLKSNLADARVTGTWSFQTLSQSLGKGMNALAEYVSRTTTLSPQPLGSSSGSIDEPIDAAYEITLKDLSPLSMFLQEGSLTAQGKLSGKITGTTRSLDVNASGTLDALNYQSGSTSLAIAATRINIDLKNITPRGIDQATAAEITVQSDSVVQFGGITFTVPSVKISLREQLLYVRGATAIDRSMSLAVDGVIDVRDPRGYLVSLDTLILGLPSRNLEWRNRGRVQGVLARDVIRIDSLVMQRARGETISLTGAIAGSSFQDLRITMIEGSLSDVSELIGGGSDDAFAPIQSLHGTLRQADVTLNGTFEDPLIDLRMMIDSVSYAGTLIGNFRSNLLYENENLTGEAFIRTIGRGTTDTSRLAMQLKIESLPIDLALASRDERFIHGREVLIDVRTDDLPIAVVSPFLPGARMVGGDVDASFKVSGMFPNLVYSGRGKVDNARVVVEGNNILYYMNASLRFQENVLYIEKMTVQNDPREILRTLAKVTGEITFDGLSLSYIDVRADIERLLVLSDATQAVNETVYGDLVIASGLNPIRFAGSLERPRLSGDLVILSGDLKLPQTESASSSAGVVKYISYEEWQKLLAQPYGPELPAEIDSLPSLSDTDSTRLSDTSSLTRTSATIFDLIKRASGEVTGESEDLADNIIYDLTIYIQGRLFITVEFGALERLRAELANEGSPLIYRHVPGESSNLTGVLSVRPGSEYVFFKKFNAVGILTFQEDIQNPSFNITATHDGRRVTGDGSLEDYSVIITITGTLKSPKIELSYTINGTPPAIADRDLIQREAISLLLFGRTSDEMKGTGLRGSLSALGGSIAGSSASTLASSALSQAFANTGFIQTVAVDFGELGGENPGDEFTSARVNVVSQFGKVIVRYTGQISAPDQNTITVEIPFALITDIAFLRDLSAQIQREVKSFESVVGQSSPGLETETWRFRVQYRTSWE